MSEDNVSPLAAAPAPTDDRPKRIGWPKGKPRGPAKKGGSTEAPRAPAAGAAQHCEGCAKPLTPLSLAMVAELVRVARDRVIEEGASGTLDLLFLAARVDGYCTIGCWKHNGATEDQTKKLERK